MQQMFAMAFVNQKTFCFFIVQNIRIVKKRSRIYIAESKDRKVQYKSDEIFGIELTPEILKKCFKSKNNDCYDIGYFRIYERPNKEGTYDIVHDFIEFNGEDEYMIVPIS